MVIHFQHPPLLSIKDKINTMATVHAIYLSLCSQGMVLCKYLPS